MSQGPRVLRPERGQVRWEMVDLDTQLPPEHRARLVWSFVSGLDLADFYARIKARDDTAGRPASDPTVLLAVWLYATLEGIGAARAIERLCEHHAAYRWLCGGVPVNHDMLSAFRRDSGPELDQLLTQSLPSGISAAAIPNALSSVFSADWLPVCGGSNAGRNKRPVKAAARRRRRSIGANGPSSRTQHKL